MNEIRVNAKVIERTALAILVNDGRIEAWVPIRLIKAEIRELTDKSGNYVTTAIMIAPWVAKEKGLQEASKDDQTPDMFGSAE